MALAFLQNNIFQMKSDDWSPIEPYGEKSYDEVIKDLSDDIYLECPEKIRKSILGLEKNFSARLFQNASLRTNKKEQILVKLLKSYQVC